MRCSNVQKRDGSTVPFDPSKIRSAVYRALKSTGLPSGSIADKVTEDVTAALQSDSMTVEGIQDLVETALMKRGLTEVAKAYILYRDSHTRARKRLQVVGTESKGQSITDRTLLMVQSMTSSEVGSWDRSRIVGRLRDIGLSARDAAAVAKETENRILATGLETVSTALIRELVNVVLKERDSGRQLRDLTMYQVPRDFIDSLMSDKSDENSNIVNNNPEAVNLAISELVLKQYALDKVFSKDVRDAHNSGMVYIHDLSFPHRLYCSSHSIEYIKKYGLRGLQNLNTESRPAKSASVLTGHLNTFLASMQSNYAGALGLGYINILYAPYLVGMDSAQLHQVAQELVFNGSQNAFSRGGQTLFLDFNIHTGVPSYLKDVPAIGPGGQYMYRTGDGEIRALREVTEENGDWSLMLDDVKVLHEHDGKQEFLSGIDGLDGHVLTYGDYEREAQAFAHALLDVWMEGDARGRIFEFPKCDFHVSAETFTDPEQTKVYRHACELAAHNGSTYFIFDRDAVSLAACCRLRIQITDMSLLRHPEHLRTVGFQNVTVNVPQAAFRASRRDAADMKGLLEEIDRAMDIAVAAHLEKKAHVARLMASPGCPLWQVGKTACDGRPYVDLETATYIIGLIGVNDAIQFLTGKQMHESQEAMDMALQVMGHMYLRCKEYSAKYGLSFKLEESPAESAARKLAKTDLVYFRPEALKVYRGGSEDYAYYTNSIHLAADAPVDLIERIEKQAMFNSIIEAGAITHAFIGEQEPSAEAIEELIRKVFLRTQSAQVTFSPEFTYCNACGHNSRGLNEKCPKCGSTDVVGETRIVGYFSRITNWNKSKRYGELAARQSGRYNIMGSADMEVAK